MKLSASLRYKLARLRVLANPLALVPLSIVALVIVLLAEYRRNPAGSQWEGSDTAAEQDPEAEFNVLNQLLNESQSGDTAEDIQSEFEAQTGLDDETATDETVADNEAPFAEYLEQYRFGNGVTASRNDRSTALAAPNEGQRFGSSTVQTPLTTSATSSENALSLAISQLQGQSNLELEGSESDAATDESSSSEGITFSGVTNLPNQSGVVPGSLSGSDTTFIRTTPSMSPPPGTTGYTPPASLNFNQTASPIVPRASTSQFNLEQQIPGAANNVLPTPGSVTVPTTPAVPALAEPGNEAFVDNRSSWERFWNR